jgi:AcrR family transcriptional regulator
MHVSAARRQQWGIRVHGNSEMMKPVGRQDARQRILDAAYALFAQQGTRSVGIDTIIERSGVAKMTLYRHFKSKQDLVLAFLARRETLWTEDWLIREVTMRAQEPRARLLAIFDVYHEWFHRADFEGCAFVGVLLEHQPGNPIHAAAAAHLAKVRGFVLRLAEEAGINDAPGFCDAWHMLMNGAAIAASEGNRDAAAEAKRAAKILLDHWDER